MVRTDRRIALTPAGAVADQRLDALLAKARTAARARWLARVGRGLRGPRRHLRMIEQVSAFVGVSWPLSHDRFRLFTTRTHLAERYPAFHGLTFVQAVRG